MTKSRDVRVSLYAVNQQLYLYLCKDHLVCALISFDFKLQGVRSFLYFFITISSLSPSCPSVVFAPGVSYSLSYGLTASGCGQFIWKKIIDSF